MPSKLYRTFAVYDHSFSATNQIHTQMSASGPKQTSLAAPHMSAFEGKADMG